MMAKHGPQLPQPRSPVERGPSVVESTVVPVFKRGDVTNPDDYRPIALVSCAFRDSCMEGLLLTSVTASMRDRGFRWEADACVYGLVDGLLLRQDTHTVATFVDICKAFDS